MRVKESTSTASLRTIRAGAELVGIKELVKRSREFRGEVRAVIRLEPVRVTQVWDAMVDGAIDSACYNCTFSLKVMAEAFNGRFTAGHAYGFPQ